jgi:hypothetical protein
MNKKLPILPSTFNKSLQQWDEKALEHAKTHPLKTLSRLPKMDGIAKGDALFLRAKSLYYLLRYDKQRVFFRYFFQHPFKYSLRMIQSYCKRKSYKRDADFFFYGIENEKDFQQKLEDPNHILAVGFSYCHKPYECPSGRFSSECINAAGNPICGQCFIGKVVSHLPIERTTPLFIPTIHYIGEKIFQMVNDNPTKKVIFLITACEMTLEMFGDWGNMVGAKGIGVRLDGRICNTMKAFKLSEEGIKPGLTVVTDPTKERILSLIAPLHSRSYTTCEKA